MGSYVLHAANLSKPNSIAIPTSSFQQPANVESNNILRPAVPLPAIPIPTIPLPPHIQTTTKIWNPVTGIPKLTGSPSSSNKCVASFLLLLYVQLSHYLQNY